MSDAQTWIAQGYESLEAGELDAALACFRQATTLEPANAQAWYCQGTIHSQRGEYREAVQCYGTSAKSAGDKAALPLYNMGNAFQELGERDRALRCFELATQADPDLADAWINRGRLLDDAGRHQEAIGSYDVALGLVPDDIVAWANRGNSLRAVRKFAEALRSYEQALAIDAEYPAARIGAGACHAQLGQTFRGLQLLDAALADSGQPLIQVERAVVLGKMDRHAEALSAIDAAIDGGVNDPQCWNNRGEFLARLGRPAEALVSFDKALEARADFAPAWFGKARVLAQQGRPAEALAAIERYFHTSDDSDDLADAAHALVALCEGSDPSQP